jgi:AP-4 complex subunit beta-1
LVRDVDTNVISNAIQALNEILINDGGIVLSTKLIVYLLNRIKEFNEWGQMVVLDLAAKFLFIKFL